jgi:hypothetical protein
MTAKKFFPLLVFLNIVLFACMVMPAVPDDQSGNTTTPVLTETIIPERTETASLSPSPTETMTETPLPPATATVTETITSTPVVTYAILRGRINVERASCRYGPGAMYLYLYGLREGANQDIIGRTDTGKWVLTRSRGDNKSCWVRADLFDIKGDVMSVEMVYPDKYHIPPSNQGYLSPWDVAAARRGDQVAISWKSEALRPGDGEGDEEGRASILYVIETWVCQGGQLVFTPIGAYVAQVSVIDEPGCSEPSHGRVFFAEKHGYAGPSEIPWPQAGSGFTATATP